MKFITLCFLIAILEIEIQAKRDCTILGCAKEDLTEIMHEFAGFVEQIFEDARVWIEERLPCSERADINEAMEAYEIY